MKVYCIGIGGIGLSALARYYKHQGHEVYGSDSHESELINTLRAEGMDIVVGVDASRITEDFDKVVYTIAISASHQEYKKASSLGITSMTYPEALGEITKDKITIAVSGTHGKTTTTAMVYSMLKECGINPTVIVGSLLSDHGSNFVHGDSEYMLVEACEYKRSFLNLHPTYMLVTNIDEDHLDYYKDIDDITSAFQSFADMIPESGALITHGDITLSSSSKKINADLLDRDSIELSVLGEHNKSNAQLALALAKVLSLKDDQARKGLLNFTGTWRRLEYKGVHKGGIFYDDYGHHPTEIKATLQALREKYSSGKYRLIVVFQPHLYSRTRLLLNEFSESFALADTICVLPIYAAREHDDESVSSHDLVEKTYGAIFMETFQEVHKYLDKHAHSGSLVLTLGAGDVYHIHELFTQEK